ncbi:MAG: hypothetical protein QOE62_3144 [Actinomycetota bacterium]|jgi:hypothetical protein|nr:hypothetical protein [Actinomycetota bacterium]
MFVSLVAARTLLDEIALAFDAPALSAAEAVRVVDELGSIRRVVDGMLAKSARRVAETHSGSQTAAAAVARSLGVGVGEVRGAIETATKLEHLPATDRAVREGRLSGREAELIAGAASRNPSAEAELLAIAEQGLVPLQDACIAARARVEDPAARRKRQHGQREFRSWTDADGMWAGRFRYAPEVGGAMKAAIEKQVQRIFRDHKAGADQESNDAYAADAVAAFVLCGPVATETAGTDSSALKGIDATVHILADLGALRRGGTADGEVCEIPGVGPVDVGWVTELLGSAFLTLVIKNGKDITTVAHLGRHIPAEVLTALIVSGRECDVESCHHRGYLERDHVHDYAKGGATAFWNLGWLCYRHHRLKSAGWRLGPADSSTRKRTLRAPPARAA